MNIEIKQKAMDILIIINTAIKNVRLYPPTSSIIANTIDRLHLAFLQIFCIEESLIIAESEKNLLLGGELLSQKDHEKMQVTALLEILLNFGIKSITFNNGLKKEELAIFLEYLSRKPETVKSEGGLAQVIADKNLSHILLDEKVYVARDKNQQILSNLDLTDDEIIRFLNKSDPELPIDREKLQEIARNPEWLLQSFETGLSHLLAQNELSSVDLTGGLTKMMALMDKAAGPLDNKEREKIAQGIGKSISELDPISVQQIMSQNIEHLFGGMLIKCLASELTGAKPADLSSTGNDASADGYGSSGDGSALEGDVSLYLGQRLEVLLKDSKRDVFSDPLMADLPKVIEKLVAIKQPETIENIIIRLLENMFDENPDVRAQSSAKLVDIIESLPGEQKSDLVEKLSGRLLDWIKFETSATDAYQKISYYLRDLIEDFIRRERFAETIKILDVFNNIRSGNLDKNDTIHQISVDFISSLASEEQLLVLFNLFNTNEQNKQIEVGEMIVRLGDVALNRLLDLLQQKADSNERVRIMRLIIGLGNGAVPFIRDRINEKAPWYYLRNMAYMLGHIGNEASAGALQPLLLHENNKVRLEALKSIYRIGGDQRCSLLLPILPQTDDLFRLDIIETLGNAKSTDAVPDLLDLLKTRPVKDKSMRANLEEKICIALGTIGAPEAIPALSEIAGAKSFLGIGSYPEKVKNAAGKALLSIKNKKGIPGTQY